MVDGNTTDLASLLFNVSYVFMYKPRHADAGVMAGISGSGSDLQARGNDWGVRFDPAPWPGPCRRERDEGQREKEREEGEREREVNALDSSRSRAPLERPSMSIDSLPSVRIHQTVQPETLSAACRHQAVRCCLCPKKDYGSPPLCYSY
ncbi:hypothetical protein VPH35_028644 [Triticum aestivum]